MWSVKWMSAGLSINCPVHVIFGMSVMAVFTISIYFNLKLVVLFSSFKTVLMEEPHSKWNKKTFEPYKALDLMKLLRNQLQRSANRSGWNVILKGVFSLSYISVKISQSKPGEIKPISLTLFLNK